MQKIYGKIFNKDWFFFNIHFNNYWKSFQSWDWNRDCFFFNIFLFSIRIEKIFDIIEKINDIEKIQSLDPQGVVPRGIPVEERQHAALDAVATRHEAFHANLAQVAPLSHVETAQQL